MIDAERARNAVGAEQMYRDMWFSPLQWLGITNTQEEEVKEETEDERRALTKALNKAREEIRKLAYTMGRLSDKGVITTGSDNKDKPTKTYRKSQIDQASVGNLERIFKALVIDRGEGRDEQYMKDVQAWPEEVADRGTRGSGEDTGVTEQSGKGAPAALAEGAGTTALIATEARTPQQLEAVATQYFSLKELAKNLPDVSAMTKEDKGRVQGAVERHQILGPVFTKFIDIMKQSGKQKPDITGFKEWIIKTNKQLEITKDIYLDIHVEAKIMKTGIQVKGMNFPAKLEYERELNKSKVLGPIYARYKKELAAEKKEPVRKDLKNG